MKTYNFISICPGSKARVRFGVHVEYLTIISESDPVCGNNMTANEGTEGDFVEWSCEVGLKGRWAPAMEWTTTTSAIRSEYENTTDTVKCSFVMQLKPADDGRKFSCRTFFDEPKPRSLEPNRADNIISTGGLLPVYTSPAITVNCKYSFGTFTLATFKCRLSELGTCHRQQIDNFMTCHCAC